MISKIYKIPLKQDFMSCCKLEEDDEEGRELQENDCYVGRRLTSGGLFDLTQVLLKKLKFGFDENETDFLNSFFLNDIEKVKKAVKKNDYGSALRKYLAIETDTQSYCDVRHE